MVEPDCKVDLESFPDFDFALSCEVEDAAIPLDECRPSVVLPEEVRLISAEVSPVRLAVASGNIPRRYFGMVCFMEGEGGSELGGTDCVIVYNRFGLIKSDWVVWVVFYNGYWQIAAVVLPACRDPRDPTHWLNWDEDATQRATHTSGEEWCLSWLGERECPPIVDCPECENEYFPEQVSLTISGVVGCEGRCSPHNLTVILPRWTLCGWGASGIFPQPDEPPDGDCAVLEGSVFGVVDIAILGPGQIEVTIHDGVFGVMDVFSTFTGTFSGACGDLNITLSNPTVEADGAMTFACPECDEPDEPGKGWCDWTGATLLIEALP